jgi:hypothetical protein
MIVGGRTGQRRPRANRGANLGLRIAVAVEEV